MSQPPKAAKAPGEGPFATVNANSMIGPAAEIDDLGHIDRGHVTIFALLDVQYHALRTGLKVVAQLGGRFKVLAVRVVTQLTVLGQAERMETSLDVENNGEFGTATNLNNRWSTVVNSGGSQDLGLQIAHSTLSRLVVTTSIHGAYQENHTFYKSTL